MTPPNPVLNRRAPAPIDRSSAGLKLLRARPLSRSYDPLPTAGNRSATTATAATPFIPLYIAAVTTTGIEQP
jgi:hypothetical protein